MALQWSWLTFCFFLQCSKTDMIVYPVSNVVSLPSEVNGILETSVVLSCVIIPQGYIHSAWWITPQGKTVRETSTDPRYFVTEGFISLEGQTLLGSNLHIKWLSYSDSGNYTCMVRDLDMDRNISQEAVVELKLSVKLEAPQPSVTTNQTSQVDLLCNMSDYIRPDNHLQWIGIDGSILSNSRRYTVTFINTTNFAAQNGGTRRSPTRLSTLTIRNVTSDDTGIYSCIVRESRQFASINLTVVGSQLQIVTSSSQQKSISNVVMMTVPLLGLMLTQLFTERHLTPISVLV